MKKRTKTFSVIIIILVILGLILPFSNIFAQENLQTPLKEVSDKVDELIELRDNNALSDEEKNEKEIIVRKEALEKILDLSFVEINDLRKKLNDLDLTSDEQKTIKDNFLIILDNNENYSKEISEKLKNDGNSLDEIKALAQEYKNWRDTNYNKYVKNINLFILTFQEKQVLKIAETRLDKIMSDLKKLEDLKILKKTDTQNFVSNSIENLTNAKALNKLAEEKVIALLSSASTTISTKETLDLAATSTTEEVIATSTTEEIIATSSEKIISLEDEIQNLIEKSLQEIKSAYGNFLNISIKVSRKLKIK